jgi:hypothetical protein
MFVSFVHTDNSGGSFSLNTVNYPLNQVDTHVEMSDRPVVAKQQIAGQWGVYTYSQKRIWHVEGDIMGQSMAHYDQLRRNLLNALLPQAITNRTYTGTVQVTDETPETFTSLVTLVTYSLIQEGLYPSRSPFMFEWESDDPFVYKTSDGLPTYI